MAFEHLSCADLLDLDDELGAVGHRDVHRWIVVHVKPVHGVPVVVIDDLEHGDSADGECTHPAECQCAELASRHPGHSLPAQCDRPPWTARRVPWTAAARHRRRLHQAQLIHCVGGRRLRRATGAGSVGSGRRSRRRRVHRCRTVDRLRCTDRVARSSHRRRAIAVLHGSLDRLLRVVERELGGSISELTRVQQQVAVGRLDELGAFTLRRAVEDIAAAAGISRFTVYCYLNARYR